MGEHVPTRSEVLTRQLIDWEIRGRGWSLWPGPVEPEPPFRPFLDHFIWPQETNDDGHFETILSRLGSLFLGFSPNHCRTKASSEQKEPSAEPLSRDSVAEFQILLPRGFESDRDQFAQFLLTLSLSQYPISFELIGRPGEIVPQFTAGESDVALIQSQFSGFFPEATLIRKTDILAGAWADLGSAEPVIIEFGLSREFLKPVAIPDIDPLVPIAAALAELNEGELGIFQVLFRQARNP